MVTTKQKFRAASQNIFIKANGERIKENKTKITDRNKKRKK